MAIRAPDGANKKVKITLLTYYQKKNCVGLMLMMTPITISKTMMTRKDLDMGGGKRTKREESSNSTSSYKEAAECVALGITIVTYVYCSWSSPPR